MLRDFLGAGAAQLRPLLIGEEDIQLQKAEDGRFNAVERGVGPLDRAVPSLLVSRQENFASFADTLDDGAALEDLYFSIAEAGNLVERLFAQIFRRARLSKQADPVVELRLFECPTGAKVADDTLRKFRDPAKGSDLDGGVGIEGHVQFLLGLN